MFGFHSEAIHLDPAIYSDNGEAYALAKIVALETEVQRAAEGGNALREGKQKNAILGLLNDTRQLAPADLLPWCELLARPDAIERCARKMGADQIGALTSIIDLLAPPNWQTFFWMREYLRSVPVSTHKTALQQAIELGKKAFAREQAVLGGKASALARRAMARAKPQDVLRAAASMEASGEKTPAEVNKALAMQFFCSVGNIQRIRREERRKTIEPVHSRD